MNLLEKLALLKEKSESGENKTFPLSILLNMIEKGTDGLERHDPEMYNVALYLTKWLEPIGTDTSGNERRKLSKLEGNHLTEAIAYWAGIPESVIVDSFSLLRTKGLEK